MKIVVRILLAIIIAYTIGLGIIGYNRFQSPTTGEMEEFFSKQQNMFEGKNAALLTALSQKKTIDLDADAEVGYLWIEMQPEPHSYQDGDPLLIRYYTHLRGIGVSSFGAGIAYFDQKRPEQTYPSLEAMADDAEKTEGFIGYSHIAGNWYFFFWEAD